MAIPHNLEKVSKTDIKYSVDYHGYRSGHSDPREYILRITGASHSRTVLQSAHGVQVHRPAELGLPLAVWERFARQVGWTRPRLIVTGGEPLLHAEIDELLALLHRAGAALELVSDGWALGDHLDAVIGHVETVHVSLLGFGASHDHYFGHPGAWRAVTDHLSALRGRAPDHRIAVTVVLLPGNVEDVPALVDWAAALSASVTLQHPQHSAPDLDHLMAEAWRRQGAGDFDSTSLPSLDQLDDQFVDDAAAAGQRARERAGSRVRLRVLPELDDRELRSYYASYDHLFIHNKRVCVKPWQFPTIEPDGTITLCHNHAIGSIRDGNFWTSWNNAAARQFRRGLMRAERFPLCTRCSFLYRDMDELEAVLDRE